MTPLARETFNSHAAPNVRHIAKMGCVETA